jgi:hypothetical protein
LVIKRPLVLPVPNPRSLDQRRGPCERFATTTSPGRTCGSSWPPGRRVPLAQGCDEDDYDVMVGDLEDRLHSEFDDGDRA